MSLPTVTDLKVHANLTSSTNDTELGDMLDAAVDIVEGIVGPVATASVTETHYNVSSGVLVLRSHPASAITAVLSRVGATSTALTLTDYELDAATGIVRRANGTGFYGTFVVTYAVGRAIVPAAVRLAILIIAGHMWKTQRGTAPTPLDPQDEGGFNPGAGYAIPNRAADLLAAYRLPVIA